MRASSHPTLVFAVVAALAVAAAPAAEPEPFRRDEIDGRDFEYNEFSFLHRFTYRFRDEQVRSWEGRRAGFRATVGSVRSDEFYVFEELRLRLPLDQRLFFDFRHKTTEDFDSRYDRNLVGFGATLGDGFTAAVLGDLAAEKGSIDVSAELGWRGAPGRHARVAVVAADAAFNQKTDGGEEYQQRPVTWFAEGQWATDTGVSAGAWVNWNADLRLMLPEDDLAFSYEQLAWGASAVLPVDEALGLHLEARGEEGSRSWRYAEAAARPAREFERDHLVAGVEARYRVTDSLGAWLGFRHLMLDEELWTPDGTVAPAETRRRERIVHGGLRWQVRPRILLWPGLYIDVTDISETSFGYPGAPAETGDTLVKLAFPIEIRFAGDAFLTLNPTIRIDDGVFGGGNAQLQCPL